jgi:parallel beta-helix repeat protein
MPDGWSGSNQASWEVPGALVFRHAQRCGVRRCTVRNLGQYAIELPEGAWDCDCIGNTLTDLGAGGIKVWHGCRRTRITDNEITHGGRVFHSGIGVLVGQAIGTQVLHNHVMDFDYSAVSVGWTWGYQESHAYGNVVEHNHLQDIGHGRLSDMAAVYTLGVQPGTRVRFNLIHDVWSRTYGGWGLYTDEGSSYILLENNLCYNCKTGGFHQHYGRENVVRNNILALATTADLQRSRAEPHRSFLFESNIIYCTAGKVWGGWLGGFHPDNLTLRRNLYFAARRQRLDFSGMSWRQWRKLGLDEDSVLADPKFVYMGIGYFRLSL